MRYFLFFIFVISVFAQEPGIDNSIKQSIGFHSQANPQINLVMSSDTVWAGTYKSVVTSGTGVGSNVTVRDMFQFGRQYTIARTGWLLGADVYYSSKTALNGTYIKIWRKNGNNYDFIGITENFLDQVTAAQLSHIRFTSSVWCQEGDFYSVMDSGGAVNHVFSADANAIMYYRDADARGSFNWKQGGLTVALATYNISVRMYLKAPLFCEFGNSLWSYNNWWSSWTQIDTLQDGARSTTIGYKLADTLLDLTGDTAYYINVGHAGDKSSDLYTRIGDLSLKSAKFAVCDGIINDFLNNVPAQTVNNNWSMMLDSCNRVGVKVFAFFDVPCTPATDNQMLSRDTAISLLTATFNQKGHYIVSVGDVLGTFRTGGSAGNYWDSNGSYFFGDNIHPNEAGNLEIMKRLITKIQTVYNLNSGIN